MKKGFICFLGVLLLGIFVGVVFILDNDESPSNIVGNNIDLNKNLWVEDMTKYFIHDTDDTFEIVYEITAPKSAFSEDYKVTTSFVQTIKYLIVVDGVEYVGSYSFGNDISYDDDKNPRYKVEINDCKEGAAVVNIRKKYFWEKW